MGFKNLISALLGLVILLTASYAGADTLKCVSGLSYSRPSSNDAIPENYRGVIAGQWADGNCGAITLISIYPSGTEGQANYYSSRTGKLTKFDYALDGLNLVVHFDRNGTGNQMVFTPTAAGEFAVDSKYANPRTGVRNDATGVFKKVATD